MLKSPERDEQRARVEEYRTLLRMFMEVLIVAFYPVELKWYEVLIAIVAGALFGFMPGFVIGTLVKGGAEAAAVGGAIAFIFVASVIAFIAKLAIVHPKPKKKYVKSGGD